MVRRGDEASPAVPDALTARSDGFRCWSVVNESTGAVHAGFGICELDHGGRVDGHVHSFEESFFLLSGEVVLETAEGATLLREGDYGLLPVGVPHGWRNDGGQPARWAESAAPQPRSRFDGDTVFVPAFTNGPPVPVDVRDPRTRSFGHIEPAHLDVGKQTQDMLAVSASMRTALLVYSGITVKMMVDADLGAHLSTMFMVRYEPEGLAGSHDHPFEETYLILDGEVDATFDGASYRLSAGDVAWAGVGCVHAFTNPTPGVVRWLETQAPQPPARHAYRFARDWNHVRDVLS